MGKSASGSYTMTVMSTGAIATGIDGDPLVAIFRAYILWKAQVVRK